jgi:hypothetical protein
VSLLRVVVCRNFGSGNLFAPARRDSIDAAARNFNDESASMLIELHCQEIDTADSDATKVWKRTLETSRPKRWNQRLFQSGGHVVSIHDVWLSPISCKRRIDNDGRRTNASAPSYTPLSASSRCWTAPPETYVSTIAS